MLHRAGPFVMIRPIRGKNEPIVIDQQFHKGLNSFTGTVV